MYVVAKLGFESGPVSPRIYFDHYILLTLLEPKIYWLIKKYGRRTLFIALEIFAIHVSKKPVLCAMMNMRI